MQQIAPAVLLLDGFPRHAINLYLVGNVLADAGARMDKKRILRQLQGQSVTAYEFATAKAQELGTVTVIAVVDESGHLIAFRRIDNAALLSVEVAQRKAYTSLMAMPPQAFANVIKDDPVMVGAIQRLPRTPLRRRAAHPC